MSTPPAPAMPHPRHCTSHSSAIDGLDRAIVLIVATVVGLGALVGGAVRMGDTSALGSDPAWLEGSLFTDVRVSGFVLLFVISGGMLCTEVLTLARSEHAAAATLVMGFVLLVWGVVETWVIGYQGWMQFALIAAFMAAPAMLFLSLGWRALHLQRESWVGPQQRHDPARRPS